MIVYGLIVNIYANSANAGAGMISENYRDLNAKHHKERPGFGAGGGRWADKVKELCTAWDTKDVLDYGCGKGKLAASLNFEIQQYDPAMPKYAAVPKPADIVVCTDVLEHIEPEHLTAVLGHLRDLTRGAGLFNISTRKAHKSLSDGRNAHLIVQPKQWWLEKLHDYFASIEPVEEHPGEFTVLVALPKNKGVMR